MIDFLHVTKVYKSNGGVREIDCQIDKGEIILLDGPDNAGKTTFLRLLTGTERPDSGRIVVSGTSLYDLSKRELLVYRRQLGIVSKEIGLLSDRSLLENVALPLFIKGEQSKKAIKHKALDALSTVGLTGRAGHRGKGLSTGEIIRTCLARALTNEPALLLMDDPTHGLDEESKDILLDAIIEEQKQGVTIIIATSDTVPFRDLPAHRMRMTERRLTEDIQTIEPPVIQRPTMWTGLRP